MTRVGNWIMAASSAAGLALSIFDFVSPDNGIHGSAGALLVTISSALILGASLFMAVDASARRGVRIVLDVLLFLGIALTGLAAYMLETNALLALMVIALVGWLLRLTAGPNVTHRTPDMRMGRTA